MLGKADLMLGVKITHLPNSITLSQCHYVEALLELYGMALCKPVATPLISNSHMEMVSTTKNEAFLKLGVNYHSAVGNLSYLSVATRPDLSFVLLNFVHTQVCPTLSITALPTNYYSTTTVSLVLCAVAK
ncbi:hypothetical protein O181_061872 [Austropuccinia psidii MF-1]|uniref:Reverse transcriptase Ty1/copia-type domain-containing protein n=1 Tax=Austropuccinia psidii MF-1 TaxID=1389203 RepID=A0A9Q3ELK7_9BASI|nr:hypothetical protein [Austropuccinia psidii MF-1]